MSFLSDRREMEEMTWLAAVTEICGLEIVKLVFLKPELNSPIYDVEPLMWLTHWTFFFECSGATSDIL